MLRKLIYSFIFLSVIFASGGFDNGTATGKGKFKIDLTWNPFDKIEFGQTYAVISYGITNRMDLHAYFSRHKNSHYTWYAGIFYQFYKSKTLDLATAIGTRRQINENLKHTFFPQILYNKHLTNKISIGGSFVNVFDNSSKSNYGTSIDIALFYKINYKSKLIDNISIGFGGFHPANTQSDTYFLPTYSIDIVFN